MRTSPRFVDMRTSMLPLSCFKHQVEVSVINCVTADQILTNSRDCFAAEIGQTLEVMHVGIQYYQ